MTLRLGFWNLILLLSLLVPTSRAFAQAEGDDVYDPFTDYSEFDESTEEEADINFFKNGRFLTIAAQVGMRGFTENLARAYKEGTAYGLNMNYFFDLRLALSLGYQMGDHGVQFETASSPSTLYDGTVSITSLDMNLKYYLNTQNVTKGLADLNPYIVGGLSQISRSFNLSSNTGSVLPTGTEKVTGLNIGAGIEIPMLRRKAYLGIQGMYHPVTFSDESKGFIDEGTPVPLKFTLNGDYYDMMMVIGLNF